MKKLLLLCAVVGVLATFLLSAAALAAPGTSTSNRDDSFITCYNNNFAVYKDYHATCP